jgi:hypothetical protein
MIADLLFGYLVFIVGVLIVVAWGSYLGRKK